jgi:hypothetical protein
MKKDIEQFGLLIKDNPVASGLIISGSIALIIVGVIFTAVFLSRRKNNIERKEGQIDDLQGPAWEDEITTSQGMNYRSEENSNKKVAKRAEGKFDWNKDQELSQEDLEKRFNAMSSDSDTSEKPLDQTFEYGSNGKSETVKK